MKCKILILLAFAGLQAQALANPVMYVTPADGKIHAADGSVIVIRGFNQNHWWGNQDQNDDSVQDVSETAANTVLVVFGPDLYGIRPPDREAVVRQYIINEGVNVIVEDHGATCAEDTQSLNVVVDRWLTPANVKWLTDRALQKHIILNIANEWSGTETNYIPAYKDAIARIRHAGIKVPLLIDANGCGQNMGSIYASWQQLLKSDPQKNIIFSIHMYGWVTDGRPGYFDIATEMDKAVALHIPLIVGEFSNNNGGTNGVLYDTRTALSIFNRRNIGWTAWVWNGGGQESGMDMIAGEGWRLTHGLTPWGDLLLNNTEYGLKAPLGP